MSFQDEPLDAEVTLAELYEEWKIGRTASRAAEASRCVGGLRACARADCECVCGLRARVARDSVRRAATDAQIAALRAELLKSQQVSAALRRVRMIGSNPRGSACG